MKILIISPSFFPLVGGTEVAIHEISKRLTQRGHNVTILTPKWPEITDSKTCEKIDSIQVHRFPVSSRMCRHSVLTRYTDIQLRAFKKIIELDRNENFDIFHQFHLFALGGAAVLTKKFLSKPLITTLHGWDTYDPIRPVPNFLYPYLAQVMNKSDVVTSISQELAKQARKQGCRKKIKIIPIGVDVNRFNLHVDGSMERRMLGIKEDEVMVLSAQRLVARKRVDCLINAVPIVIKKSPNVNFVICGKGPEKERLIRLANQLNVRNNIIFTGFIPDQEIAKCYSACDIFVLHSLYEGLGTVLIEAMACGKPVVTTIAGATSEVVEHEKTGLLVPPKNPEALANAVMKLIEDDELRIRMGMEGRRKVEREYDWDVIFEEYFEIHKSLAEKGGSA